MSRLPQVDFLIYLARYGIRIQRVLHKHALYPERGIHELGKANHFLKFITCALQVATRIQQWLYPVMPAFYRRFILLPVVLNQARLKSAPVGADNFPRRAAANLDGLN